MSLSKREMQRAAMRADAQRFLALEDQGYTTREIARECRTSQGRVCKLLLSVRPNRSTRIGPEAKADLARDYIAGVPRRAIGLKAGVSMRRVSSIARDMGLPGRTQ